MDRLTQAIDAAIQSSDYGSLSTIFGSSFGGDERSWQSLGQGEQRTLASYFIKTAVSNPTFLQNAFKSALAMRVMDVTLKHLPTTGVDNAADNTLRQMLFDFKVEEEEYIAAAMYLDGLRMTDDEGNPYFMSAAEKCDVYVKIAECYLEEDETVKADGAVTKAGTVVESITNPEEHMALILRYKSTYARVLDANRKFLQAASRYHDLSQANTDMFDADDLLRMLGMAATCAILAPSGPQRQRILGLVFKDERLSQLDAMPDFETHSAVLTKMYMNQVIRKDDELNKFEKSLAEHQKAMMGDGLSIVERAVIEHNMVAVSKLYTSIYFSELGQLLGVAPEKAEKVAAKMIMDGSISGSIDQVDGTLNFEGNESALLSWDEAITSFCVQLNRVTDVVRGE
uniref:COP9 signalosome complex subunit 4 n=2 Tax=Helicotheca tamesis TaxID=374047 RepID=A0A7S2DY94_9STRA|mmetsp:Transcript_10312/g.14418  ORF Transcript_10312/g.14418 Transcript_10312/m.14418 type:complete len:398 (+) Transcript_10312:45-1238(+)|eukprot:CAMPEP_0185724016 /NCGR_PEP_ID=MMETSP1171-20130828/638_1 /TAXON_ID=374046 /ORGANISM="Helicotheca tamensis, Strain CCMP826" /LENGTH=397 /DNA_ID=CAMNT_0028391787 /DNA_START=45 /DNA_END=1238 /DNA_ORIENTATION=+